MHPGGLDGIIVPVEVDNGLVEYDSSSSNRKRRSVAWDHFEKLPCENKDAGKAKCRHCDMVLSATPKSGTSHLRRHVERCPKRIVLDIRPISIESASGDFEINIDCDPHRRKISKVWDEFEKFRGENVEEQKARCKHCHTTLSAAAKNGTSHLKRHLEKCTRRIPFDDTKPSITSYFSEKQPAQSSHFLNYDIDKNELRTYILRFIVEGAFPFSLVEKRGFRQMMSMASPQFTPFSRSAVKKELFSVYAKEKESLKEMLANIHGRICLSTENWSARDTDNEYICVTANFIDDQWKMHRRILYFRPLLPVFDRIYVGDEVAYMLTQWNIGHKTFSITMDGASYNDSLVSSLERGLISNKLLPLGGSIFQVRCYANILNLFAESVLKLIADDLNKMRDLVKYVNKSPSQRKKFYDLAEKKFQLAAGRSLRLDVPSRWNSTYKLIDCVLYYKNVFMHVVEWEHNMRSEEDWQNLNLAHKFLKMLYDMTCMVTSAKYPTANIYLKGLLMVHRRMLEISKGSHCFLTNTIAEMQAIFDKYWSENSSILACAAILDPRYKVKFVEYCYMKLSANGNVGERVSRVVNTLYILLAEYKRRSSFLSSPSVGTSGVSTNFASGSDEGDMFGDYNQFLSMSSKSQGSKSELDLYLEEPSYDLNSDLDVLEFWSKSSMRYPVLAVMARDILSVPVSSTTFKSAFHIGGKTLSILSSIMPETLQALVCLQDWMHAPYDSDDCTLKGEELDDSSEDLGFDDDDDGENSMLTESF